MVKDVLRPKVLHVGTPESQGHGYCLRGGGGVEVEAGFGGKGGCFLGEICSTRSGEVTAHSLQYSGEGEQAFINMAAPLLVSMANSPTRTTAWPFLMGPHVSVPLDLGFYPNQVLAKSSLEAPTSP